MDFDTKKMLLAELLHIAEETKEFEPPYIPSRYLQDVTNSDPAELIYKYVLAKDMTDGYERLWREGDSTLPWRTSPGGIAPTFRRRSGGQRERVWTHRASTFSSNG